ncbi:MAG: alpha/beta hydrolase, partial [Chloroflexi bacterium]|nr:alpha/beta hydrolase [Chloroflexota bacterium]
MRIRPTRILAGSAAAAAALALLVRRFEYDLIFWPRRDVSETPADRGLPFEQITLEPAPGARIYGWLVPHALPRAVVLYLEGNGGNRASRLGHIEMLREMGCSVVIVDYQGYGESRGHPTEESVYRDARAARAFIASRPETGDLPLVLYGESLGGAVATMLAREAAPSALIVDHGFTSMPEMVDRVCRGIPASRFCRSRFDSISNLRHYHGPVLITHGDADALIPHAHGERLFAAANEPKRFFSIPGAPHEHNEVLRIGGENYRNCIREFLDEALARSGSLEGAHEQG